MDPGLLSVLAFMGLMVFCIAAERRLSFAIPALSSLLTGLFYGFVWLLKRSAYRKFREAYGDLGIYSESYQPRGWHSIVLDYQFPFLFIVWGIGVALFLVKFVSETNRMKP